MKTEEHVVTIGGTPTWTRGDRFRKARELTGLSQTEFAARIGVGRTTVINAEAGRGTLSITARAWIRRRGLAHVHTVTHGRTRAGRKLAWVLRDHGHPVGHPVGVDTPSRRA